MRRSSRDDQYHGVMPRSCKALQVPGSVNFCEAVNSRRHDGGHRIGGRSEQLGHKPADAVALGREVRPVTVRQCFEFYQFGLQCVDRRGQGGQGGIDRVMTTGAEPFVSLERQPQSRAVLTLPMRHFTSAMPKHSRRASRGIFTCRSYALLFVIDGKGVDLPPVRAGACGDNGKRFPITGYYIADSTRQCIGI